MLSFLRTKSEATVNKIVNGTKDLSLKVDETPIDVANMESTLSDGNTSLKSHGYQNEAELKETIYGLSNCVHFIEHYII